MSFQQNQEENRTTSTEQPSPGNPEQARSNIAVLQQQVIQQDNRQHHVHRHRHVDHQSIQVDQRQYHVHQHHHHHIDQQVVQVDQRQNITNIISQPEQCNVSSGDQEDLNKAFDKLKQTTRQLYKSELDVDVSRFDNPTSNFPEVHPELLSVDFYEGRFIPNDDQYDPKTRQITFKQFDKKVSIDQLISCIKSRSFISIVGYPGAGKTTLSKRLARRLDETRRDFLVLRIPFMSMNDCDDKKLTLKEFLLGDVDFDLNTKEKDSVFKWIKNHIQNCFLIFDGFDQVNWNLMDKVERSNYVTLLTCQELVSNLCRKTFLRNCHIVFTSRPHAMLKISKQCRPKQTYFVGELTSENMKKLFDALINDEQKSSKIFHKLTVETPHLESICHNPLMLQLYLRASLSSSHEAVNISTMTQIFQRVLGDLRTSEHTIALTDEIVLKLSRIAYNATHNGTVVITTEDLQKENLLTEDVQDIVVALLASNKNCGLLEGNQRLYFSHQTFQEFFSALYMVHQMPLDNFTSFVQTDLLVDHWSVVVQFLSGLLLDSCMNEDLSSSAENQFPLDESTSAVTQSLFQTPPLSTQTASSSLRSTTIQSPSEESDVSLLQPPSQQTRLSSSDEKLRKREVFLSELCTKTQEVAENHNDEDEDSDDENKDSDDDGHNSHSIIPISRILREGNNEEVTVAAGSHFDGGKIVMESTDTQNDFHAVTSFLKSMPGRIGMLDLAQCEMNSNKFRPWKEAIKSMPGSIVQLDLQHNFLFVHDVIEVMSKVEEEVWMVQCLDDGCGRERLANMMERSMLKEALDGSDNKKLKILVDDYVVIIHKDRDD